MSKEEEWKREALALRKLVLAQDAVQEQMKLLILELCGLETDG